MGQGAKVLNGLVPASAGGLCPPSLDSQYPCFLSESQSFVRRSPSQGLGRKPDSKHWCEQASHLEEWRSLGAAALAWSLPSSCLHLLVPWRPRRRGSCWPAGALRMAEPGRSSIFFSFFTVY